MSVRRSKIALALTAAHHEVLKVSDMVFRNPEILCDQDEKRVALVARALILVGEQLQDAQRRLASDRLSRGEV